MILSNQDGGTLGYMSWKGWDADGFGVLSRGDSDYFSRETRDAIQRGSVPRVLEIGFGNGTFLAYCRSVGWSVTGTELLPELVELATEAGYRAVAADRLDTLADASFDLVVAFDVFEHIPPEHSIAFLTQLASKLRDDGRILLRYPNADTWIGNPFQHGDVTHVNAIGALKMEYYAGEANLEIVRMRATKRRGFRTSIIHGLHAYTAGVLIKAASGLAKVMYFPDVRVVLSSSNVVTLLRKRAPQHPGDVH
jgi:SAM-dependent methyltransferase